MRRVAVLNSSPRKGGNSDVLATALVEGAESAGGHADKFDLARMSIGPCRGCFACQMGHGDPCVQKDDMGALYDAIARADAVVLATPLYWQQMNGIMKNAVDRMFALAGKTKRGTDTALIVCGGTPDGPIYDKVDAYFREAFAGPDVLDWNVVDVVNAGGLSVKGDAEKSPYRERAYGLGRRLAGA